MITIKKELPSGLNLHILVLGKKEQPDQSTDPAVIKKLVSQHTHIVPDRIYLLNQVHGDKVVAAQGHEIQEADGLYTTDTDRVLVVKTADCMPVFIWSENRPLLAMIHTGWKGLKLEIVEKFLRQNQLLAEQLSLFVGPCISQNEYEIGREVAARFSGSPALKTKNEEKSELDLAAHLRFQLKNLPLFYQSSGYCCKKSPDFFSHRAGDTGRNLNCIWLSREPSK